MFSTNVRFLWKWGDFLKKALLAMFHIIVILIFILIFFTLYGRAVRHTEVCDALELSMKQAITQLQLDEGGPSTEEEWVEHFIQSIAVQIHSKSDLTVHIYAADMHRGLLSAEAILTFKNLVGTESSVSTGKKTILLEEYYDTEQ